MKKKTENKKIRYIFVISLLIAMSFIFIYAGHFLFGRRNGKVSNPSESLRPTTPVSSETEETPWVNPVKHIQIAETINGLEQKINILEIDLSSAGVKIQPVLSHDLIYGFETLSKMAERKNAYAAVNGGFFHDYGLPSGMVVIDGELISASTGRYPVFIIENGTALLKEIESSLTVEYRRGAAGGSGGEFGSISVDRFNFPAKGKEVAVYTPVYGRNNRAGQKNITATVENGIVTKVAFYTGEAEIPRNGMLVSFFDTEKYAGIELPIRVGDAAVLSHHPPISGNLDAYECGSWLVRDGKPVVPLKDAWVGVLTNRDPRTAVGIKEDGTVVLLTVDGRQPGYSAGFTGKELAEYLISCGVTEAAMLDGGASTEMLVGGELVSRPSFKGEERPLAGGILVLPDR